MDKMKLNDIDIENITKIINSRKEIKYKKGGNQTIEYLNSLSTDELKRIKKNYKENARNNAIKEFKEIVDTLFEKYGIEGDNCIVLSECYGDYDGGREFYGKPDEYDTISACIDDEPFEIDGNYNEWCNSVMFYDHRFDEDFKQLSNRIVELQNIIGIDQAEKFFADDYSVNCYWHGYIGVMKDYKIVYWISDRNNMDSDYKNGPDEYMQL